MKDILFSSLCAFLITFIVGLVLLPALKKVKANQPILSYVKEHELKSGTPTMGGVFFLCGILITCLIFFKENSKLAVVALAITIGYGIVGFLDDFIKIKFRNNLGLKAYQKIIFQLTLAAIAAYFAYLNHSEIIIPFFNNKINIGYWVIPLTAFVFLAMTNSVNLTDGLDGLASGTTLIYTIFFSVFLIYSANNYSISGLTQNFFEYKNMAVLSVSCCGALLAYMCFNAYPAKVFMGDTGSLALGGLLASLSVFSEYVLFVPFMGIMFIVSSVSVIMQVVYFKITKGRRIFLMAPYHHHLQHKGVSEGKITMIYMAVTAVVCMLIVILTLYSG